MLPFGWESPVTNRQISSKWQPEKSALPTLSRYKSLANTIKRHLCFLPNDDSYNIHLKSLIVSSRGETSGLKEISVQTCGEIFPINIFGVNVLQILHRKPLIEDHNWMSVCSFFFEAHNNRYKTCILTYIYTELFITKYNLKCWYYQTSRTSNRTHRRAL